MPFAYAGSIQTDEDTSVNGTLSAFDADGDPLTYTVVGQGTLGAAVITNASSGTFTYTPNANANGGDSFTFKVDDGKNESNIATVSVTINPVADEIIVNDMILNVIQGNIASGFFSVINPDGGPLTYTIVSNGAKGTASVVSNIQGSFIYEANAGVTGSDQFTYKITSDGIDSRVATVDVTIRPEFALIGFDIQTPIVSGKNEYAPVATNVTLNASIGSVDEALVSITGPMQTLWVWIALALQSMTAPKIRSPPQ